MRSRIGRILRPLLKMTSALLKEPRVIYARENRDKYLSRWYLFGNRPELDDHGNTRRESPEDIESMPSFNIFLHCFHRSDSDRALHCHPWQDSFSIILSGGYLEERRVGDVVKRQLKLPFSINVLKGDDYHRVDLLEEDCWSIFFAGKRVSSWAFWDRDTGLIADWKEFLNARTEGREPKWVRPKAIKLERVE